jgi:hypothetical protein
MKKIINNILHRLKEDSLARQLEGVERNAEYKGFKDIRRCLVFWTSSPNERKWIKSVRDHFAEAKIEKLCFVPNGIEVSETDDVVFMRNDDLGFGGKIQNERLLGVLRKKYDLLIDLTGETSVLGNYVLAHTQAACTAGMKKEGGIADLIVDGVSTPLEFIDKLTELLSKINRY